MPVAFITGAGNGIGAGLARRLGEMGYRVAVVDVDEDAAKRVADEIGDSALPLAADITDMASLESAVDATVQKLGGIDVAVANAGFATAGSLRHLDLDAFDAQIRVNLGGTYRTVRACLPALEESRGYLTLVASLSAILPPPGLGAYASSKAATEALGDVLRVELADLGIDVGVAYFAWVGTDLLAGGEREQPAFRVLRDSMRWPLKKVIPVDEAVEAIVRGIGRRSPRIMAPGVVRPLYRLRALLGPLAAPQLRKVAPEIDAATLEAIAERGLGGVIRDTAAGEAAARSVGRRV
jgi:NAD(P)-dependent dehydrogenase (short-subunit alcohol dehydrogenase family)